jgi:3-phenylpropionate/trans-cinnamate dioxygenase ferredoxin component
MSGAGPSVAGFVRAAHVDDVEATLPLGVILDDGRRVCLVRDGEQFYAVDDRCPHRDFALSGGDVIGPCVLECPWHGAQFDVRTGEVLQGPATDPIGTYAVHVEQETIFVGPRLG